MTKSSVDMSPASLTDGHGPHECTLYRAPRVQLEAGYPDDQGLSGTIGPVIAQPGGGQVKLPRPERSGALTHQHNNSTGSTVRHEDGRGGEVGHLGCGAVPDTVLEGRPRDKD